MSSNGISVSVRGVSKAYTIYHNVTRHTTIGEALVHRVKNPFQRAEKDTVWALKEISFELHRGETVGIIGRNGAGKSTLLKILCSIVAPTIGEIDLYGPVGSLLEVGTGFHPELTGRENIYLNAAIIGMRRIEINKQFDAIVDFAEVRDFLDTPVKRYSTGMYVRLAFAIAAQLSTDILIVDEVLAVGDLDFQEKCLRKIDELARSGRTVFFVSHNMNSIRSLCKRVIWIEKGEVVADGKSEEVVAQYLESAKTPN
jgi:lipopolysaccharide transport system ATP-binding protein